MIFAYLGNGSFVVSDGNASPANAATLWSPQGCAQDGATGTCPSAFKGFADSAGTLPYSPGATWTARRGASSNAPSTPPTYMAVITTAAVTKSGSTISGRVAHVVIVQVLSGSGDTLTGTVVGTLA